MRLESCRKCGNDLEIKQNCFVCTVPIQFHCVKCGADTDEQIHYDCFMKSFNQQLFKVIEAA